MRERLPDFLKRGIVDTDKTRFVRNILKQKGLNTVCDSARCPNKNECYCSKTATFMILGNVCTRNCRFCNIESQKPEPVNKKEPQLIAEAVQEMGLDYVVITSVTRDDLPDGGSEHFASVIRSIRNLDSAISIEVLTPDFKGDKKAIDIVLQACPDVFNHNVETVQRLYKDVRPQAFYERSLEFLSYIKDQNPDILTKSGLMVGLGETNEELSKVFKDLAYAKCDIVTVGQYIQPSLSHAEVKKYYKPEEYKELEQLARAAGIKHAFCGPLVRSSYKAKDILNKEFKAIRSNL